MGQIWRRAPLCARVKRVLSYKLMEQPVLMSMSVWLTTEAVPIPVIMKMVPSTASATKVSVQPMAAGKNAQMTTSVLKKTEDANTNVGIRKENTSAAVMKVMLS